MHKRIIADPNKNSAQKTYIPSSTYVHTNSQYIHHTKSFRCAETLGADPNAEVFRAHRAHHIVLRVSVQISSNVNVALAKFKPTAAKRRTASFPQ